MILLIILLALLQYFTPFWWWVIVLPLGYGFIRYKSGWRAFFVGSLSAALVWLGFALYLRFTSAGLIERKIGAMMELASGSYLLLIMVVAIAFFCGGFGACSGFLLKVALQKSSPGE